MARQVQHRGLEATSLMIRKISITSILAIVAGATLATAADKEISERLQTSTKVLQEATSAPDGGIPGDLLEKAHCAVIVPGLKKGAFIVSAKFGRGFITCRNSAGWSAPAAIKVEGGGVGFQIGASETDVILLVMNDRGAKRLMSSEFTLGAEGEVAAGPVGRNSSAQTDAKLTAEILSWSRARGVFAGVSLQGATLREDKDGNADLYGRKMSTEEVVNSSTAPTPAGKGLTDLLTSHSPREDHR